VFVSPRNRVAQIYPPGIGFPFCRLLRLPGIRWRYSIPPPHEMTLGNCCCSSLCSLGEDHNENTVRKLKNEKKCCSLRAAAQNDKSSFVSWSLPSNECVCRIIRHSIKQKEEDGNKEAGKSEYIFIEWITCGYKFCCIFHVIIIMQ
jgi:hypothetical protein